MILDSQLLLSDAQAITADAVSTNTVDTGAAGNDISIGEQLVVAIQVDVTADFTTGDEVYVFEAIQSAAANLGSPDILVSRAILASDLTAGSIHYLPIPAGSKTKRYLGLNYNVGGTTPSITCTAFIQPANQVQAFKPYADGFTIS
jgi:NAD(P)-dependent dehydrogenase (short-subunit alcohol dehydrogenase family)